MSITELESLDVDMPIERWSARDQCQLCHESLQWLDYNGDEIDGLCMKTEQHSMQKGVKAFGDKGKESAMKEMRSLTIKNQCFVELEHDSLTQEQKDKALPLLMFMFMKRNGTLKSRGVANGKIQKLHSDQDCTSPTPCFCAVKHACGVAAVEERDTGTVDLPNFFLQT